MILEIPTIFGMGKNGQLLAGGEAGPEAVVGVKSLRQMIKDSVQTSAIPEVTGTEIDYVRLGHLLKEAVENIAFDVVLKLNDRVLARETATAMDRELAKLAGAR